MRIKQYIKNTVFVAGVIFIQVSFASQADNALAPQQDLRYQLSHGKFELQLGLFSAHQGKTQNIDIQGLIGDYFSVTSHNGQNMMLGVGYYVNGPLIHNYQFTYGLNAFYLPDATVKGMVYQENIFENLSYQYDVSHYPLYVMGKTEIAMNDRFNLMLDIGLGPEIVQTSNFEENSRDGITLPDHLFSGGTQLAFSGTVGVGVKFNNVKVYKDAPLECGYRFFYLGQGDFDKTNNQVITTLKTGNGYANAVICSVAL